ncbi:MAG: CRISPR-associated protein Cas4 [Candidatus Sericytochromatia bacterium]
MIRISDIKQYIYCPRVIYYQYCLMIDKKNTFKMDYGSLKHNVEELLESRRKLKSFGLGDGIKEFEKYLQSDNLSGRLDLLITTETNGIKSFYPVDYKYSKSVHTNHIYQIVGYSLLIEEIYKTKVDLGFIYLIPLKNIEIIKVTEELKTDCVKIIENIEKILDSDVIPEPTNKRSRCVDCEYNRFCNDIW